MSFFGTRRARQTRVFRPTPSIWEKLSGALQDYRVLTQLMLALFAVVAFQIAVQSWSSRFPYREGQVSIAGVQARVDFSIANVHATDQARIRAEEDTRLVFVQNNDFWTDFESRFRKELTDVANATDLSQVPPKTVAGFGLSTEIPGDVEKGTSPTTRFARVKTALSASEMPIGERLTQMGQEFSLLLDGAKVVGILDAEAYSKIELPIDDLTPQRPIEVVRVVDGTSRPVSYKLMVDISLKDQLLETGCIGRTWVSLPNLQQIRPAVEAWLNDRLKGQLTFDAVTTAERRREAFEKVETQYDVYPAGRVLVTAGSLIQRPQLELLTEEFRAQELAVTSAQRLARVVGATLMLLLMVLLFGVYLARSEREVAG